MEWSGESRSRVPISIPDYLIYDEIRRRRDSAVERDRLELPLYNPKHPPEPPPPEERDEPEGERGPIIINMNDLPRDSEASEPEALDENEAPDDPEGQPDDPDRIKRSKTPPHRELSAIKIPGE